MGSHTTEKYLYAISIGGCLLHPSYLLACLKKVLTLMFVLVLSSLSHHPRTFFMPFDSEEIDLASQ